MNWSLAFNSAIVAGGATLMAVLLGSAVALALLLASAGVRRLGLGVSLIALALPPFLVTNAWLNIGTWIPGLDGGGVLVSLPGAALVLALLHWPLTTLLLLGAWQALERSQFELDPGLRGGTIVRWLLWPQARRPVGIAASLTMVLALNNFAIPTLLQVKVLPEEVWLAFNTRLDHMGALAAGWPMIVVPLLLIGFLRPTEWAWPQRETPVDARFLRRQLGPGWWVGAGLAAAGTMAITLLPALELLTHPRTWREFQPALAAGQRAAELSFLLAAGTATLPLAVSLGLAWHRWPGRNRPVQQSVLAALAWLPCVLPGIFLGIVLLLTFNRAELDGFRQGPGILLLALGLRYGAAGASLAGSALRMADQELIDTVRANGGGRWQILRHAVLPRCLPRLAGGWYAIYLIVLWDVETVLLLLPPGSETLACRIFNLLHYGHSTQVNALCIILLALAATPALAWFGALRIRRLAGGLPLLLALAIAGCSRSPEPGTRPTPTATALPGSRLFDRVMVIGHRGTGAGEFNKPRSVTVDHTGHCYVVDMTGRVQKFAPDGRYILSWQMPQTDLGKAKGLDCDRDGLIVVVEPHYQRINHFTPEGRLVSQWGRKGTNAGDFALPRSVAINSRNEVIVPEYSRAERIQCFTPRGASLKFATGRFGDAPGEFNRPEGIGIDTADRIYVADSCNHRIQVFHPDGRWLRTHGHAGTGPGAFSYPYDVRVDANGLQFVCEFGNSRIQILDAQDRPVEILGGPGSEPGRFANPWSLAFDSDGNLYVADALNHRVQKFYRRSPTPRRTDQRPSAAYL